MAIGQYVAGQDQTYGYCDSLQQIKTIVTHLFPGVVEKTDFSPLE